MDDDVRDLGRKARERREVGISKRSAIVRLEAEPAVEPKKQKSFSLLTASSVHKKKPARPRKRSAPSKRNSNAGKSNASPGKKQQLSKSGNSEVDVDTRTPDISHLTYNPNQENVSNTVRIHGLPVATKRGDLIRFFAGLNPKHIFMLPHNSIPILEWDAVATSDDDDDDSDDDDSDNDSNAGSGRVKRHPNSFRVFVRFDSAPVASLAAQRSGEEIYMGKASDNNETRRQGASIAVSQVPKATAKYLFQNMAVECSTNNMTLQDILAGAEQRIHKLVPKILWTAAKHDLGILVTPKTAQQKQNDQQLSYKPLASLQDSNITTATAGITRQGYTNLAKIHNQLLRDYDSLVTTASSSSSKSSMESDDMVDAFPLVALCGCPDMLRDPATRLTNSATTILLEKSQRLETYLHMARTTILATTSQRRRHTSTSDSTEDKYKGYSSVMDRVLMMTKSQQQQPVSDVPGQAGDNAIAGGN